MLPPVGFVNLISANPHFYSNTWQLFILWRHLRRVSLAHIDAWFADLCLHCIPVSLIRSFYRSFYRSFWANLVFLELIRHYNEYHSRSGWLLCPLCLRVFSNDTTYEHHMNTHITKGRFFRCQSCRLVFESENFRTRHEQEMHHSNRKNPAIPQARLRFLVKSVRSARIMSAEPTKRNSIQKFPLM